MKRWISHPLSSGQTSKQAHADFPQNTFEREMGKEGFFGPAAHFYHKHPPTAWTNFEGDIKPRAIDSQKLKQHDKSIWQSDLLLENNHCVVGFWHCSQNMIELNRNADGDLLLFTHQGSGQLFCDFGVLDFQEGDYLLIPRGCMWRIEPASPCQFLHTQATNSSFQLPEKGILGQHAIFDESVLEAPVINQQFLDQQDENPWQVLVKRHNKVSTITYGFNPLDAQGWKGTLSVVRLNWRDIRPIMSHRYHLPPSVHTTFVADRFVVCTFCPRPIESDPGALKVPFFHNNDDFDEVLFYHKGDFFSRDNIHPGMMTLHPAGFTHGPHPKALKAGLAHQKTKTDEVAVMIDTRDALMLTDTALTVENKEYVKSWQEAL